MAPMNRNRKREQKDHDLKTKKYIRKALELGLSSGYLVACKNSDSQVLRVTSDILKIGRCFEEPGGSHEPPARNPPKRKNFNGSGKNGSNQLVTKNGRTNIRKRGRSRTKSPKIPATQKRRRKRSLEREKVKVRSQKRKRLSDDKEDEDRETKNKKQQQQKGKPSKDEDNEDDEEDESDSEDNSNKNSNEGNKKSPVAGRPGSIVSNTENNLPRKNAKEENDENKQEDSDKDSAEPDDDDADDPPERSILEEDAIENNEESNVENS